MWRVFGWVSRLQVPGTSVRTGPVSVVDGGWVDVARADAVSLAADWHISVAGNVDTVQGGSRLVIDGLVGPGGGVQIRQLRDQGPENAAGPGVNGVRCPHVVCAFQRANVGLPELGLPLDRLVAAYHVQVIFEHFGVCSCRLRLRN